MTLDKDSECLKEEYYHFQSKWSAENFGMLIHERGLLIYALPIQWFHRFGMRISQSGIWSKHFGTKYTVKCFVWWYPLLALRLLLLYWTPRCKASRNENNPISAGLLNLFMPYTVWSENTKVYLKWIRWLKNI